MGMITSSIFEVLEVQNQGSDENLNFYAPNFEEVQGHIRFGPIHPSIMLA